VEPHKYAFSDLILQAKTNPEIRVRSASRVYRRYVDAAELMDVALRLGLSGRSVAFDSGGTHIEIGDLAEIVAAEVGPPGMVVERDTFADTPDDDYSTDDSQFRQLAAETGVTVSGIREQILRTAEGVVTTPFDGDGCIEHR
jgi:nucleoside-diphosphate-sugar epimerase